MHVEYESLADEIANAVVIAEQTGRRIKQVILSKAEMLELKRFMSWSNPWYTETLSLDTPTAGYVLNGVKVISEEDAERLKNIGKR